MGFFKSSRELMKMGQQELNQMDVGARMANAQAQMANAQAMMQQQTAAAQAATTGVDATATLVAVRQGGGMINFEPIMALDLTVMPPGGAPYPVTVSQPVPPNLAGRLVPGASLRVKIDPHNQQSLWIDPTS
ncbi:MAG TPA: hypothetical protein VIX82_02120 [Solirubrobacteraceae bacterium]